MTARVPATTDPLDAEVGATVEPDPFAPDVTIWPEPPEWLFPSIMVLVVVTVIAMIAGKSHSGGSGQIVTSGAKGSGSTVSTTAPSSGSVVAGTRANTD